VANKVNFPAEGKAITFIVPFPAGGSNDLCARLIAPLLEKKLHTSVQIVNKGGAGSQLGNTELVRSKPDGYTIGQAALPTNIMTYLDPERKAAYSRADFQPIANFSASPLVVAVKAESPYTTLKDLIEAAKSRPDQVKVSDSGLLTAPDLATRLMGKTSGARFAGVHFDGGAPALTALLGGHVDAMTSVAPVVQPQVKNGSLRLLATMDREQSKLFPGVKTMADQGYQAYLTGYYGITAPSGIPKEVVDTLSEAVRSIMDVEAFRQGLEEMGQEPAYLGVIEFSVAWEEQEKDLKPFVSASK